MIVGNRSYKRIATTVRQFEQLDKLQAPFQRKGNDWSAGPLAGVVGAGGITAGSFGIVNITDDVGATIETIDECYLDRVGIQDPGSNLDAGVNVFVDYFKQDNKWRVVCADCPSEPTAAPPGHGDLIEASATQTQAGGTSINYSVNRVTVCATDNDAVTLLDAVLEEHCFMMNDTDNILQVFPDTDNRFTRQGLDASVFIPARTSVDFQCVRANTWVDPRGHDTAGRTFDGTDDYISIAAASWPDNIFSNDFTLVVDVLVAATTDGDYFMQQGNGSQYLQSLIHSNKWAIGTTGGWVYIGNEAMQTGLYVIQYDTAETGFARWKAWLDGTSKSTATTFGTHTNIADSTDDLNLGRRLTAANYLDMTIRDFRVYSGLRTHAEVIAENTDNLELWWHLNDASAATEARDVSGNGRDGTYTGTTRYEP